MNRIFDSLGTMRWIAATGLLVLAFMAGAKADQRDPQLDSLFAELQRTTNQTAANGLVAEIWQRWTAFEDDPRATNMMAIGIRQMNLGQFGAHFQRSGTHPPATCRGLEQAGDSAFHARQ